MASFIINKDQIARLKVFNDYCKKMESISPIEENQSFIIKQDKLCIYGKGETSSQIDAKFDISSVNIDKNENGSFGLSITNFVNYLEKIKEDEITVTYKDNKITIKGKKTNPTFSQTTIWNKSDEEIKEIESFISTTLAIPEFKKPIIMKISSYRDIITDLANMTKFMDVNQLIEINKESIKSADNACVLSLKVPTNAITSEDKIYLHRDIINLFKGVDEFQISDDRKWYYFDIAQNGIKILFIPKTANWQYPSDADIDSIIPIKPYIATTINTKAFFDVIDNFENIFDSGTWKFKQIKFKISDDFDTTKKINLHWDNISNEVLDEIDVNVTDRSDQVSDFEFILPTVHFKFIKSIFEKNDTFEYIFSSKEMSEPNGAGVIFQNSELKIILAKMLEG